MEPYCSSKEEQEYWRHDMEMLSASLAIYMENPLGTNNPFTTGQ